MYSKGNNQSLQDNKRQRTRHGVSRKKVSSETVGWNTAEERLPEPVGVGCMTSSHTRSIIELSTRRENKYCITKVDTQLLELDI